MDIKPKVLSLWKIGTKYKYVCIIILVGVMLMLIPDNKETKKVQDVKSTVVVESDFIEQKLEEVLSMVSGAGKVRVLLTTLSSEESVYVTDDRGSGENQNRNTVIITDSNRNQSGLIQRINSPIYKGAIIVCDGADNPEVQLAVTEAVMNATGLRSNQISVLKMK